MSSQSEIKEERGASRRKEKCADTHPGKGHTKPPLYRDFPKCSQLGAFFSFLGEAVGVTLVLCDTTGVEALPPPKIPKTLRRF